MKKSSTALMARRTSPVLSRPDGPVRGPALDEARLEVQVRLLRLELEGGDVAVLADGHRLEALLPVLLRSEHHAAAP
jgi:hypothetical protein